MVWRNNWPCGTLIMSDQLSLQSIWHLLTDLLITIFTGNKLGNKKWYKKYVQYFIAYTKFQ